MTIDSRKSRSRLDGGRGAGQQRCRTDDLSRRATPLRRVQRSGLRRTVRGGTEVSRRRARFGASLWSLGRAETHRTTTWKARS